MKLARLACTQQVPCKVVGKWTKAPPVSKNSSNFTDSRGRSRPHSYPWFVAPNVLSFAICHLPLAICHWLLAICYRLLAIARPAQPVAHYPENPSAARRAGLKARNVIAWGGVERSPRCRTKMRSRSPVRGKLKDATPAPLTSPSARTRPSRGIHAVARL
jgi:hypothetical protein